MIVEEEALFDANNAPRELVPHAVALFHTAQRTSMPGHHIGGRIYVPIGGVKREGYTLWRLVGDGTSDFAEHLAEAMEYIGKPYVPGEDSFDDFDIEPHFFVLTSKNFGRWHDVEPVAIWDAQGRPVWSRWLGDMTGV